MTAAPLPEKISIRDLKFFYGSNQALKNITLPLYDEACDGVHRPVGLRQVHAAARAEPHVRPLPQAARRRRDHARRREHPLPEPGPEPPARPHRHGVPEADALPHVDLRQHRLRHPPLRGPAQERDGPIQSGQPVYFTGEMVYPWMFEEYEQLRPLREAAEILARDEDWPALYDLESCARNSVPVAAAVYYDDMYVERTLSEEAAQEIKGIRLWVTNEYEHNGLRADGERVLGHLLDMLK